MYFTSFFQEFVFLFFLSSLSVMSYIQNQRSVNMLYAIITIEKHY